MVNYSILSTLARQHYKRFFFGSFHRRFDFTNDYIPFSGIFGPYIIITVVRLHQLILSLLSLNLIKTIYSWAMCTHF